MHVTIAHTAVIYSPVSQARHDAGRVKHYQLQPLLTGLTFVIEDYGNRGAYA